MVPLALEGEAWDEQVPAIQDAGADTIEFSFDVEISKEMWEKLETERLIAQLFRNQRRCEKAKRSGEHAIIHLSRCCHRLANYPCSTSRGACL